MLVLIAHNCCADSNLHRYMWANYQQFGGHLDQANEWYSQIFSSGKPSAFSNKGYIHLLNEKKDYPKIVALIPKLDKSFAKDVDIQLIFVQALKNTGKTAEADNRLIKLNQQFKTHPEVTFHTAETLIRRKQLANAIQVIDEFLNNSPNRPNNFIFHFLKSQAYSSLNQFDKAQESIKLCLDAHPRFPQGWLLFALIQEQAGKINKAIEGYTSYLEISGSNKQIEQHLLGLVIKQKAISQNKQVIMLNRPCFEKAVLLFERKDFKGALKQVDGCLQESPQDPKARLLKVEILTALKEYDAVVELLAQWAVESPQTSHIWLQALHLLQKAAPLSRKKIIAGFEKIHRQKPTMILPILFLADLYARENKPDNALVYHQKALNYCTSNELKSRILFQIGLIHYEKLDYRAMKQALEQVVDLQGNYPPALNLLAYYYATEGKQLAKAQQLIEKALEQDSRNPHFLDTKAVVLYKQGKYREALKILRPIAKALPKDSTVLIHLAKTYRKLGNINQACNTLDCAQKHACNTYEKQTASTLLAQWKK